MPKLISNHISVLLLVGIAAAIAMSAIHVGDFLYTTDGPLAILGGAAIAICTISSSYYAFDSTKAGKGWPWAGVVFFGVVSAAMQINHYQLEPTINDITAIAMGMLWPIGEIILGGIMASVRHGERVEVDQAEQLRQAKAAEHSALSLVEGLEARLADSEAKISEWKAEALALRNQLAYMEKRVVVPPTGVSEPAKPANAKPSAAERRAEVFKLLCRTNKKADANFADWGRTFGVSDTAVRGDVEWLKANGYWLNGDDWKPTNEGLQTFGEPFAMNVN